MKKKQKEIFLEKEGNAYYERNHIPLKKIKFGPHDPIVKAILKCKNKSNSQKKINLLEIGCGEAKRLQWISKNFSFNCYGVEPSIKAVNRANKENIKVIRGTADYLDFENDKFDFVIFGFCLYLCDRQDLFQIAKEADRVLKNNGYLIIMDFYSETHTANKYHHLSGIFSYKMDYRNLFLWHPNYECIYHEISDLERTGYLDNKNNWVATSVIRKKKNK